MLAKVFFEGTSYAIGLDAASVFGGLLSVLTQNIAPIMTLMGLVLGLKYVMRAFKAASKGKVK